MTLIERLSKAPEGSRECVLWPRALDSRGRGRIWHNGKLMLAHRWVWERLCGPTPKGKMLCHHCDNPTCVNPAHMYIGTHADNTRDARERGRYHAALNPENCRLAGIKGGKKNNWARGEKNPKAKLTPQQVRYIQQDPRATRYVAREYNVHRTTIQRIRNGKHWPTLKAQEQNDGL